MIPVARISPENPPRAAVVEDAWAHWHHKRWTCIDYAFLASGLDMDVIISTCILANSPTIIPVIAASAGILCRIAGCAVQV